MPCTVTKPITIAGGLSRLTFYHFFQPRESVKMLLRSDFRIKNNDGQSLCF